MNFGRLLAGFIGFIVFLIIILVIFGHGGKKPTTPTVALKPLGDYAETDASVSFTTDGIVNADSLHRSIRITISANQTEVDVLQGYNPQVIQTKVFENNQEAYTVFLKSIANYGFLAKSKSTKIPANEQGFCPLGFRYILDLNQDGEDLSRTWASTCGKSVGNSLANVTTVQQLFRDQIPDYQTLVNQVDLSATRTAASH
jgi:hypothetical protein